MSMKWMDLWCFIQVMMFLSLVRGEGVAIVLDPLMGQMWWDLGGIWSAISSRIVSACLQLCLVDSIKLNYYS